MKITAFVFILLICSSCSTEIAWRKARSQYFVTYNERESWKTIVAGIRAGGSQERDEVQALIGNMIILDGCAALYRKGVTSDLQTDDGIQIDIDLIPSHDVCPPGPHGTWYAEVRGIFEGVDFEKRVIHVSAKPKDYHVIAVY